MSASSKGILHVCTWAWCIMAAKGMIFSSNSYCSPLYKAGCMCVCRGRGILYRYQLQGYAKLVDVLKVILFALLLNGVSSSTSLAQVSHWSSSCISPPLTPHLSTLCVLASHASHASPSPQRYQAGIGSQSSSVYCSSTLLWHIWTGV